MNQKQNKSKNQRKIKQDNFNASYIQSQNNNYFSSFMFVDQMTQNSVFVEDLQKNMHNNTQLETQKNNFNSSLMNKNISYCLKMMKSARKFQMSSLQQKNYNIKSLDIGQHSPDFHITKKTDSLKKLVLARKQNQRKKYEADKQNLKKILNTNDKLNLYDNAKNSDKHNEASNYLEKRKRSVLPPMPILQKSAIFAQLQKQKVQRQKQQQQLTDSIYNHINYEVKKDAQFLITPEPKKLFMINRKKMKIRNTTKQTNLYQSQLNSFNFSTQKQDNLYTKFNLPDCQMVNHNDNNNDKFDENDQDESNFFKNSGLMQSISSNNTHKPSLNLKQKNLLKSIVQNNYFKVQIQLSTNPDLLKTCDEKSNNLLHICIINNNQAIFQMILKKTVQNGINLLNKPNKYRKTPLQMGKIYGAFNNPGLIEQIERINRKLSFDILAKLSGNIFKLNSKK